MKKAKPSSLREAITRTRNAGIRFAVLNAAVTAGSAAYVAVSGGRHWPLLILAAAQAVALALNTMTAVKAHRALSTYKKLNPAVTYIAEMQYAFGTLQWPDKGGTHTPAAK